MPSTSTETPMRAAVISNFGDESHVSIIDSSISPPPQKHVQVSIIYAGFSGTEINIRLGIYPLQKKAPLTPGYCFVGRVITNGEGSSKFSYGDLVACMSIYDAHAEFVNIEEKYLIPIPEGVDLQQACALIVDWNTAYRLVHHSAKVTKGQKVFVHGISGAAGYAIMILSQLQGAIVYGTCSPSKHASIQRLSATPFVYTDKAWMTAMKDLGGADAVFDALGFESWDESFDILTTNGILVGFGGNLDTLSGKSARSPVAPTAKLLMKNLNPFCGRRTKFGYISRDDQDFESDLKVLFELSREGKVQVPIKCVFDLEDLRKAHKGWGKGSGLGSMLINVKR